MKRETKKKLRSDLRKLAKYGVLLDECVRYLCDALPDSKSAVKARIEGMRSQGPDLWEILEE